MSGQQARQFEQEPGREDDTEGSFADFIAQCSQNPDFSPPPKDVTSKDISNNDKAAAGDISAEEGLRDGVLDKDLLSGINTLAAKLPEAGRKQFIHTTILAAASASRGASLNVPYIKCEDRYRETRAAYEREPTAENAKALTSAYTHLRSEQKKLGLPLQLRDTTVSLAESHSRPSQAKAAACPSIPGEKHRGRPRLTAVPR